MQHIRNRRDAADWAIVLMVCTAVACGSTTIIRISDREEADAAYEPIGAARDSGTDWSAAVNVPVSVSHLDAGGLSDSASLIPPSEDAASPDSAPPNLTCGPCATVYYGRSICDGDRCSADCEAGGVPAPKLPDGDIQCRALLPEACTQAWVPNCTGFGSECPGGIPRGGACVETAYVGSNILWCCGN